MVRAWLNGPFGARRGESGETGCVMRLAWLFGGVVVLGLAAGGACSAGGGSSNTVGSGTSSGSGGSGAGGGSGPAGSGGALAGPTSGAGGEVSCAETGSQADVGLLPADIILVIDNSGSMTDEADEVQASMNDFVTIIDNANIDVHVILISADSSDDQGICVPAPLGSGSCPNDENLAGGYMHVAVDVGSNNGLQLVLDHYDAYSGFLRPTATRTIGIISDDNASLDAASFRTQMVQKDASFQDFVFHGIVAPYDYDHGDCVLCQLLNNGDCTPCDACCGPDPALGLACTSYAEEEGTVYKDLANDTSPPGVIGNLCVQEFSPMFQEMATAVIGGSQVACVFDIPAPPNNQSIDFTKVNVKFFETPTATGVPFFNVPGGQGACAGDDEWYFDDASSPTQILLCPGACSQVQAADEGRVEVTFDCETQIK